MTELAAGNSIVVGVDEPEASAEALRRASRQAHVLHTNVVAVPAWEPTGPRFAPYTPASAGPTPAEQRDRAARLLASTLREVFGPRIESAVRAVVVEGPSARVLLRQSRGALLLALGRTPRGRYDQPTTGAVARAYLRHATVPVVAVPAAQKPASPPPVAAGEPSTAGSGVAQQAAEAGKLCTRSSAGTSR
jgi:nucleotide-binding universal stress UspA family protein